MKQIKMSPILFAGVVILSVMIGAFIWRASTPYREIIRNFSSPQKKDFGYGPWSIGIFTGPSPFEIKDPPDISNPVLTGRDVSDIEAKFVADPFMIIEGGRFYLFFEVLNRATNQGDIGYAQSLDGKKWDYKKIVIDEPFHLSYPYVFKWEGSFYLIPESHEDLSIRLYRAASFPDEWQLVKSIFNGEHYVDPAIFRYADKWWLFYSVPQNDSLNLYYTNDLLGTWAPHPKNPIVKLNRHIARPGGRVLVDDGKIYRFTQDADPRYGIQVFAFEITHLSETEYEEKIVSERPVVTMSGRGWNAYGMHHVDPHFNQGQWIAAVDGRCGPSHIPC